MAEVQRSITVRRASVRPRGPAWRVAALALLGIAVVATETARAFARRRVVQELAALGCLMALVLLAYRDAVLRGVVAFQNDTQVFYYPLELWFGEEFKAGRFPLWNPYLFGGYPIFADGELGLSYPLHLLLLHLLPVAEAFIWLRVSSVIVAAWGMYALGRALALGRPAAMLAGITYGLGSFFVTQQHHENVTRTAAWVPLILAGAEWGIRHTGWRRQAALTLAAVALGMAGRGLHPQVLAMALLAFATYVGFRILVGPVGDRTTVSTTPARLGDPGAASASMPPLEGMRPSRVRTRRLGALAREVARRTGVLVWVGGYVGAVGLGIAAVQLFPLAEIGLATFRGSQPDYTFATSYALPMQNLVNLVFPYFFRAADSEYWSLWAKWETTLYVGIAPLVLGMLGVVIGWRREVGYFLLLGLGALWLAFATYAPYDLYALLWNLPGFSSFRVPGRYTLLFILAWSVLAGIGLQALTDARAGVRPAGRRAAAAGTVAGLAIAAVLGVWAMTQLRASLLADPAGSLAWIREGYLTLRNHGQGIEARQVYEGLLFSLSLATPRTAFALMMVGAALALCLAAILFPRARGLWQAVLVAVAGVDLLLFSGGFHQKAPIDQLVVSTPAIQFLAACRAGEEQCGSQPEAGSAAASPWRVFTPGTIPSLEFDRLVPFRIEEIGGYSSLEPKRHYTYWTVISDVPNGLLDAANVRYVVFPRVSPALPSYRRVPFDPDRPLLLGSRGSIGGKEVYRLDGARGHRIQVVGALTRAVEIPEGDVVVELTVVGRDGQTALIALRAGPHLAEWAHMRPDIRERTKHSRPEEIAFRRPTVSPVDGRTYEYELYYSEHDLPSVMEVERVEIRPVHPLGGVEVYGIGLYNFDTGETVGVTADMRAKLRLVYEDAEVRIFENRDVFPRAYVVPQGRYARPEEALSEMLDGPFDPRREVLLEQEVGFDARVLWDRTRMWTRSEGGAGHTEPQGPVEREVAPIPQAARPVAVETDRVVYRASAPEGGYFVHVANLAPGWRAWVDGAEAPLLRANHLFRAVPLTPGEHEVELRYEPAAVSLGRTVSGWASAAALVSVLLAAAVTRVAGPRRVVPRAAEIASAGSPDRPTGRGTPGR